MCFLGLVESLCASFVSLGDWWGLESWASSGWRFVVAGWCRFYWLGKYPGLVVEL